MSRCALSVDTNITDARKQWGRTTRTSINNREAGLNSGLDSRVSGFKSCQRASGNFDGRIGAFLFQLKQTKDLHSVASEFAARITLTRQIDSMDCVPHLLDFHLQLFCSMDGGCGAVESKQKQMSTASGLPGI